MTASLFSKETVLQAFHEQYQASETLFKNLREQLILQVSEALKPLVAFLEQQECDEDEILQAIFEAIAYEKDAELELGTFAFDQRSEWVDQCDDGVADTQSQALYQLGLELLRQFQTHRLYRHGFLPYQYTKRHGRDLIVTRLGVPEIMHRDRELNDNHFNAREFANPKWRPERTVILPLVRRHSTHTPAAQPQQVETHQSIPGRRVVEAFEDEMRKIFSAMQKDADQTSPAAATPPDERSVMTQDELNEWFAKLLWAKQFELKQQTSSMAPEKRRLMELVYRAKVLGDAAAAQELEEHISKRIRIVDDNDEASA